MDKQKLSHLIEESKRGSAKAMEQLLLFAYTPVSFQCSKLLNDPKLAEDMSEKVLKSLAKNIIKIENADHLHRWLGNITATRCMRMREQAGIKEYHPDSQDVYFCLHPRRRLR